MRPKLVKYAVFSHAFDTILGLVHIKKPSLIFIWWSEFEIDEYDEFSVCLYKLTTTITNLVNSLIIIALVFNLRNVN